MWMDVFFPSPFLKEIEEVQDLLQSAFCLKCPKEQICHRICSIEPEKESKKRGVPGHRCCACFPLGLYSSQKAVQSAPFPSAPFPACHSLFPPVEEGGLTCSSLATATLSSKWAVSSLSWQTLGRLTLDEGKLEEQNWGSRDRKVIPSKSG